MHEDEYLVEKSIEIIANENRASTSLLQRRLRLGYTRAASILDILEERGIVGPGEGAKPRQILVDLRPVAAAAASRQAKLQQENRPGIMAAIIIGLLTVGFLIWIISLATS